MQESRSIFELETEANRFQKEICVKYGADFFASPLDSIIGIAIETFEAPVNPINGLRHPIQQVGCSNWYLWAGDYSDADDFFKPMHVKHLFEICPKALLYLGLPPGWRFLFDSNNYEDVWYDEKLLMVK